MSCIYIHIPFCRQKCNYCNFHSSVVLNNIPTMVSAICKELLLRREYICDEVETIYFGGGTPSLLDVEDINKILCTINNNFRIVDNPEITIECNPIDLNLLKVRDLKEIGFNRFSLGVQSFDDKFLSFLGRVDTSTDIYKAVSNIKTCNIDNINLDIIFAIPGQTEKNILADLYNMLKINPQHISAYCLSIEPKTVFDFWVKGGKMNLLNEDSSAEYFLLIDKVLTKHGYVHYEISNYCKPTFESKHNLSYWNTRKKYLGVGPGAHSYDTKSRQWNITNNLIYIESLKKNIVPATVEILTEEEKLHEYILTGLRTNRGISISFLEDNFTYHLDSNIVKRLIDNNLARIEDDFLILTTKGMVLSDKIISLF